MRWRSSRRVARPGHSGCASRSYRIRRNGQRVYIRWPFRIFGVRMEHLWHLWFPLQHWLAIHTGTDNEAGPFYGFFSGFGSDFGEVSIPIAVLAILRKLNCHQRGCLVFGHHDWTDPTTGVTYKLCRRHHPDHPGRRALHGHYIRRVHAEAANLDKTDSRLRTRAQVPCRNALSQGLHLQRSWLSGSLGTHTP